MPTPCSKKGDTKLVAVTLLILSRFSIFLTVRFQTKFVAECLLKLPPHVICVAALPCETLMSVINNKLQGTVVTYLGCGGIVSNQIKTCLLLSLPVKRSF